MNACFPREHLACGENPAAEDEMLYDLEAALGATNHEYMMESSGFVVPDTERQTGQISGAAVVGGLTGLLLVGPAVGLVAAGSAAVVATTEGSAGDIARTTGEKAGDVARKTREITASAGRTMQSFDRNGVFEKTTSSVMEGYSWMTKKLSHKKATEAPSSSISGLP